MKAISMIAKKHKLFVIEDAAQAIASKNSDGYLGVQSDIGCFSLSVAKTISTGQGGFAVTNNSELATKIRAIRTHGVENVKDPKEWITPGFNFRFNDILASIGIEQLKRLPERIDYLREIYFLYKDGLSDSMFDLIPSDLDVGEVPVYSEFLVENRSFWMEKLKFNKIETRPFYPDISSANYFPQEKGVYQNSKIFSNHGLYFPSGPTQSLEDVSYCVNIIKSRFV